MTFTFYGVKIKIGFLFSATVAVLLCFNTGIEVQLGILFALLHETGHLAAMIFCGEKPQSISFGLFGMTIIRQNDINQNYRQEIITALCGPLMNYFLAVMFAAFYYVCKNELLLSAVAINLVLGTFNITPVFCLDGGRALENALKMKFDNNKTEIIIRIVSLVFLVLMMGVGFYILISSRYNFTFLAITVYLTVMLFIKT